MGEAHRPSGPRRPHQTLRSGGTATVHRVFLRGFNLRASLCAASNDRVLSILDLRMQHNKAAL